MRMCKLQYLNQVSHGKNPSMLVFQAADMVYEVMTGDKVCSFSVSKL